MNKAFYFVAILVLSVSSIASAQDSLFFRLNQNYDNVKITKVLRADTFILDNGETIRMIGIKAPEAPEDKDEVIRTKHGFILEERASPIVPLEERAFEFAKNLLFDQPVRIEFDRQRTDSKSRTVAYVFLKDGRLANAEILRQGFANLHIQPPNIKYAEKLREAYREARREKRGLQGE